MYNLTSLPNQRGPYIAFTQMMFNVISDEISIIKQCESSIQSDSDSDTVHDLEMVIGGLSFGAPLAAATVALSSGTSNHSIFTKHILMSPFFGISSSATDDAVYKCLLNAASFEECLSAFFESIGFDAFDLSQDDVQTLSDLVASAVSSYVDLDFLDTSYETFNLLMRKVLIWIIEDPEGITNDDLREELDDLLDTVIGWGDQCELDIEERDRGGFCQFTVRNLLASHSFAQYVADLELNADIDSSVETLLVMVERDGSTRNSLAVNYVNLFYGHNETLMKHKATDCMWFIAAHCQSADFNGTINNECGVPHSSLAPADNLGIPPYYMPWNVTYHSGLMAWINNEDPVEDFLVKDAWDYSMMQCVYLDLMDPPQSLVADIPSIMTIGLSIAEEIFTDSVEDLILNAVSTLTGVPRDILELTAFVVLRENESGDDTEGDYYEFTMDLDKTSGKVMQALLEHDAVGDIANYTVKYVELNDIEYYPNSDSSSSSDDDDGDGSSSSDSQIAAGQIIGFMAVGILIAVLCSCLAAFVCVRYAGWHCARVQSTDTDYGLFSDGKL